jgi:nucleotide-binding universal stress UspA family protein
VTPVSSLLLWKANFSFIKDTIMKSILVPIDFQSASIRALRYIEDVFREVPVQLFLVNVVSSEDPTDSKEVEKAFEKFESKVLAKYPLKYRFAVRRGNLLDEIQNAIHQYRPSLVIIGTSGRNLSRAFVKLTDCPVMIIPENNSRKQIRNIAYANDFNSVKASGAFAPLLDLSQTFEAKVYIIHLNKDEKAESDEAEVSLEYYLQLVEHEYASIPSKDFVAALNDYVHKEDIDILSVLLRDHGQNKIGTNGKLIEELVSKADLPVLSLV